VGKVQQAAIGFRVHSGWSAAVAVFLEKGIAKGASKGAPIVVSRRRVQLVETFTYDFRQPYHTAKKMGVEEGRKFILRMRAEARRLAFRAIREIGAELEEQGFDLRRMGLCMASGRELPELEKILASHALIHTADGELFREALAHASERCGLAVLKIREKELLELAGEVLRLKQEKVLRIATEAGRGMGAPWSQDEKFATVAAWVALVSRSR
jgi:hypothetical protein